MASQNSGTSMMIVQYQWILNDVEEEPRTIASKMILFRGEKVFRVGLKNRHHDYTGESSFLFFMAVGLNKIGMKVKEITYGIQVSDSGPETMTQMAKQEIGDEGSLQLFTINLDTMVNGNCTFVFRICIEGSDSGYSYLLSDRLAKDQLWAAAKNKNSLDVEIVAKGKKLFAHKGILAARSPVFATEFTKKQLVDGPYEIRVDRMMKGEQIDFAAQFAKKDVEFRDGPFKPQLTKKNERKMNKKRETQHINADGNKFSFSRSQLAAAELTKKQPSGAERPQEIRIDDVESSTVEQFLHFIYTGESVSSLANEELLKLAEQYQLKTLSSLCRVALKKKDDALQMVSIVKSLYKESDESPSSPQIRPNKDTEIFFDRTSSTFRCIWKFLVKDSKKPNAMEKYQNETLFFAYLNPSSTRDEMPSIHFSCAKHSNSGLKIEDVYLNHRSSDCFKMKSTRIPSNAVLLFKAQSMHSIHLKGPNQVSFDAKIVSIIDNYYYEIMDNAWMDEFWTAATEQRLTDVEICVGTVKVMEAHRVILSARSPVLNASLGMTGTLGKPTVTIDAEFDVDIVKLFLKFLYSGSLDSSASHKQLLDLAKIYEVETLITVCQLAKRVPKNIEDFTSSLLEL